MIKKLRENARLSIRELAKVSGLTPSVARRRIRTLEAGTIKKYTVLLDYKALGFNVVVLIAVALKNRKECIGYLAANKSINSISRVTNSFNYMLECIFSDIRELHSFLEWLQPYVKKKQLFYIIGDIKREAFLG